jgi:hypothetical protein
MPYPPGFENITTMGSHPLEEEEFDTLLRDVGLEVYYPSNETDIIVLGRDSWSVDLINKVLDLRSGLSLRAYSQEMFLAYLFSGIDPLSEKDEMMLSLLADNHPALKFLETVGFQWPTTQVLPRVEGTFELKLLKLGLLKFMGYKVGKNGRSLRARQQILAKVYDMNPIPNKFPTSYIKEWGTPGSSKRLKKMANSLATFCKSAKRKSNQPEDAITEWETDLAWLKSNYYNGRYRFQWPSTEVW